MQRCIAVYAYKTFSIKILKIHCNLEARFIQITLHNALKDVVDAWAMKLLIKILRCKDKYFSNLTFDDKIDIQC